jgi:hypothetical protein
VDSAWAGGPFASGGSFVVTPTVRITAFERRSGTEFWLRFSGAAGTTYRVEWSADLGVWNSLGAANVIAPGQFELLDSTATSEHRFYRVTNP